MRIKNIIRKATVAALTAVMILAPIVNVKAASSDVRKKPHAVAQVILETHTAVYVTKS